MLKKVLQPTLTRRAIAQLRPSHNVVSSIRLASPFIIAPDQRLDQVGAATGFACHQQWRCAGRDLHLSDQR